jgi:hypothetical protein
MIEWRAQRTASRRPLSEVPRALRAAVLMASLLGMGASLAGAAVYLLNLLGLILR